MPIFPGSVWDNPWVALIAVALDLWLGGPRLPWKHPVCLIGSLLNFLEPRLRQGASRWPAKRPQLLKWGGFGVLSIGGGGTFAIVWLLCSLPYAGLIFTVYLAWAGLAMGCLLQMGAIVLDAVENSSLADARSKVSWLVSRQTRDMDRATLRKTLADTLAENYTDAFLAPFFWLLIAGVPGLWLYKVASTMDSQWGYLTPQWEFLGYAGAKADDALAFIPARLAPIALGLAHFCCGFLGLRTWHGHWPGYHVIACHARVMPSPNSGWPMAACAWLCSGRMAGPAVYFGKLQEKPYMGPPDSPPWNGRGLLSLRRLLLCGAISGAFLLFIPAWAISRFF